VEILLECADINLCIKDTSDDMPLHEACLSGHHDIVEALVKRMKQEDPGLPDVNAQNSESQTPLHLACKEGHAEVVRVILKLLSEKEKALLHSTRDNEENSALHLACKSGNEEIVELLIQNGANLSDKKLKGITPIHIAVQHGYANVARTLTQYSKALTDLVDIYHQTPLHYAAAYNQVEMIQFLIEK
jgi:ankyrin